MIITKRETKGRITPWVGKLADDAEKHSELTVFFKEDWKRTNIVLLLKIETGNCGARKLDIITVPVTPEKRLKQPIR